MEEVEKKIKIEVLPDPEPFVIERISENLMNKDNVHAQIQNNIMLQLKIKGF
jgi:hypothetical protein